MIIGLAAKNAILIVDLSTWQRDRPSARRRITTSNIEEPSGHDLRGPRGRPGPRAAARERWMRASNGIVSRSPAIGDPARIEDPAARHASRIPPLPSRTLPLSGCRDATAASPPAPMASANAMAQR